MGKRLGQLLIQKGFIKPDQLEEALKQIEKSGEFLGQALMRMGVIKEDDLYQTLSEQHGIPYVHLKDRKVDPQVIRKVPPRLASDHKVFPIEMKGRQLVVAVSDPLALWPLEELSLHMGMEVEPVLANFREIEEAIRTHYGVGAVTIETLVDRAGAAEKAGATPEQAQKTEDIEKPAQDASVINLVNQIFKEAIEEGATDIHFEPFDNELQVRYRIDGDLRPAKLSENIKYLFGAIISRIKIMAGLNIVEKRLPQDGRARVRIGDKEWDLRVSILPTLYGENLVIRILPSSMLFSLEKLGLNAEDLKLLERLIQKPHGIIFVTGPTGSGKTTTLYACLSRLNTDDCKIITVEDPVEYHLRGITQVHVQTKIELTFARALRNMLRHDPDIMMVGEVRDLETAQVAVQVALTGHLVFSTLHTNDSAGGVTRLVDMGVEPFLITSAVEAFLAQRLVRMNCPDCRKPAKRPEAVTEIAKRLEKIGVKLAAQEFGVMVYQGQGCESCKGTGFRGRTAIYEILPVTESVKAMILRRAPAHEIKREAVRYGMRPLIQDGWEKVKQGAATVEEILRVTELED